MTSLDSLLDRIEEREKMEGQIQLSTSATSLDFLQAIYRDPTQPIQQRMRAAATAPPFEHPKLAVTAQVTENNLAERLMRAIEATQKVINRPVQVIEPPKVEPAQVEQPDHSIHTAPVSRNGFSKRRF
jgi:hypothetical protein